MVGSINSQRLWPTGSVCQQSWLQGLQLLRTRCFFPSGGRNHCQ